MMKKIFSMMLVAILAISTMSGCGSGEKNAAASEVTNLKIGWSVYSMEEEYFQRLTRGVEAKCAELGYELIQHDQENDAEKLVSGCQDLIAQEIDALLVSPCKPEALNEVVDDAHEKGIPVIVVDIGDGGANIDALIVSDGETGGEIAGENVIRALQEKGEDNNEVAIIKCENTAIYANRRGEGFKSVMRANGYQIVQQLTANSSQEQGYEMMNVILKRTPNIAAVFAENDPMAIGAAKAIKEAGREDIVVVGFNGDDIALEAIKDGLMYGTVTQEPEDMGAFGVEIAQKIYAGEAIVYDSVETKAVLSQVDFIDQTTLSENE